MGMGIEQFATEYAGLIRAILFPTGMVVSCFILQRWLKSIIELFKKLDEFLVAFNKASVLLLFLYFIVLVLRFT